MAYVNFKNSPSEETPLTGGATGNLNVMQENGTTYGTDTKLSYSQSYLNDKVVKIGSSVDSSYNTNLIKSKNIFDKNNNSLYVNGWIQGTTMRLNTSNTSRLFYLPCKPNTTYTMSRSVLASSFRITTYDSIPFPTPTSSNVDYTVASTIENNTATSITITTGANAKYLVVQYGINTDANLQASLDTIQIEEGNEATTYSSFVSNSININGDTFTDTLNVGTSVNNANRVNVLHSKNLLPNNGSTITTNGITFTKNGDGSITINGTSTARADLYIFGGTTDNGNYLKIKKGTYSFDRSNLTDGKIFFAFREKTAGAKYETLTNNGAIETMATQDCYFYGVMIGVESGNTINDLTIYPMLNEGNTLLSYEPYITPSIYVDNEEIYSKGVVLWQNDTGVSNATITLNDSPSNYSSFDIDIVNTGAAYNYLTIHIPRNTGRVNLISYITGGVDNLNIQYSKYVFSGNKLQYDWAGKLVFQGGVLTQSSGNTIAIIKVIGYK